ncbi:hypothetical protein L3Q82_020373 [Scortum barcoo]|uniref:Uncharacterized protein n=1 Tax=Scortum barcoo TaxID=214431 RepID=A0ACB8VAG4_9TELE|nr:hypothetical protein L3Q82_020373 [Scortum barcoo]
MSRKTSLIVTQAVDDQKSHQVRTLKRDEDRQIYSAVVFVMMKTDSGAISDAKAAERERIYAAVKAFGLDQNSWKTSLLPLQAVEAQHRLQVTLQLLQVTIETICITAWCGSYTFNCKALQRVVIHGGTQHPAVQEQGQQDHERPKPQTGLPAVVQQTVPQHQVLLHQAQKTASSLSLYSLYFRPEPDITTIVQNSPSDPVRPGDSVTLQCSVLSDYENKTCPGQHTVKMWNLKKANGVIILLCASLAISLIVIALLIYSIKKKTRVIVTLLLLCGQMLQQTAVISENSLVPVKTVQLGESVTFTCVFPDELRNAPLYWYKQRVGDTLKFIATLMKTFKPCIWTRVFCLKSGRNTQRTSNYTVVQWPTVSDSVRPGDLMTLQCSVLSDSENKTCPGDHNVYWFKTGSDKSHPNIIYTDGNRHMMNVTRDLTLRKAVFIASLRASAPLMLGLTTVLWPHVGRYYLEMELKWKLKRDEDRQIYSAVVFVMMKTDSGAISDAKAAERERIYAAVKAFGLDQ